MKSLIFLSTCMLVFTAVSCDSVTYYADGETEDTINNSEGQWTEWLDRDQPSMFGEFEHVYMQLKKDSNYGECELFCDEPAAMIVDASDYGNVQDYSAIAPCTQIVNDGDPAYGFKCRNAAMEDATPSDECKALCADNDMGDECEKCPDIKVKYFCKGSESDFQAFCAAEAKRFLGEDDEYMEWARSMAKRDQAEMRLKAKKSSAAAKKAEKKSSMDSLLARLLKELN